MSREDALRAVAEVVDRLAERFPHVSRTSIERAVLDERRALDGPPIETMCRTG
ncbi:three-helix bundle dimerization domain-containing protein [Cryobacterium sp. TMT1-19]|uniref:three-helix bundle dimerization domain-containing protein n=1 Tax=unclassified Cryobacterium TaxID=2649013 RepID=UPI003514DE34